MRGQRGRLEAPREGGDDREHPELEGHLPRRRQAEREETAEAAALEAQPWPGGGGAALVAQNRRREKQGQVRARDDRRPRRAVDAEGRHAEVAEDEQPVGGGVDGVRAEQGRRHPGGETDGLQVPAERGVEQQRQHAPQDDREVRRGEPLDRGVHAPGVEGRGHHAGREGQRRRQRHRETRPVHEPPPARVEAPPAVGPRDQGIEPQQHADAEHHHREAEDAAHAHRPDSGRPQAAHHCDVDDAHRDPSELGHHDRRGEADGRRQLPAERPKRRPRRGRPGRRRRFGGQGSCPDRARHWCSLRGIRRVAGGGATGARSKVGCGLVRRQRPMRSARRRVPQRDPAVAPSACAVGVSRQRNS